MQGSRSIGRFLLSPHCLFKSAPAAGVKSFAPGTSFENVEFPERNKLRVVFRSPQYPPTLRPFKMQKRLKLMRGYEEYHNTFLHKQYGIIATGGGRMRHSHFEVVRFTLLKHLDFKTSFAIWRVQDPWQPITKKSQGVRMGSGKGAIDHYVTPVKAGQVIVEVGGLIEYFEVKRVLIDIAHKLPFAAKAVNQEMLEKMATEEKRLDEENQNPWTWKYIIQNNIFGCHKWISKYDKRWFNKYV